MPSSKDLGFDGWVESIGKSDVYILMLLVATGVLLAFLFWRVLING